MIKNRRKSARTATRRAAARKPTAADKAAGRQRATRTAKINARRGIQQDTQGKPTAMDIEREVYRQTRMNNTPAKEKTGGRQPRSRKDSAAQVKARKQQKNETKKKAAAAQQNKKKGKDAAVPTWVAGTKRPPSKKAVNAAVNAMSNAGFKVPQGMQMVISFAPAPENAPTQKKKGGQQQNQKSNQKPKGKQNQQGRRGGGGRKK